MGIITERRMKERRKRIRRRLLIVAAALALGAAAASQDLREAVTMAAVRVRASTVFAAADRSVQAQLTLPEMDIYALQVGVFDNGERAQAQAQALETEGIHCVVWQREKMRLIVDASWSRESLDTSSAKQKEVYIYQETLPKVTVRLTAEERQIDSVQQFLMLPDSIFAALDRSEEPLEGIVLSAREAAAKAEKTHPENLLYTQLAQSLTGWCNLIDGVRQNVAENARAYAAATMCMLCRELREALIASGG